MYSDYYNRHGAVVQSGNIGSLGNGDLFLVRKGWDFKGWFGEIVDDGAPCDPDRSPMNRDRRDSKQHVRAPSVKIVLENFYDRVVEGGFVVLDDYWRWPGCRKAVTDYLKEHQIQGVVLKQVDLHGVYFQKPLRCRGKTADN